MKKLTTKKTETQFVAERKAMVDCAQGCISDNSTKLASDLKEVKEAALGV